MRLPLIALLALTACHPGLHTRYPVCVETPTDLAPDAASPGGYSAADVLAYATGARSEQLQWHDGTQTPLALELSSDGAGARWIDSVADYTGVSIDIGIVCTPRLEVPAQLAFATEDGVFADTFDGTLMASEAEAASLAVDLTDAPLAGTFDPADWPTTDYDSLTMVLSAAFTPAGDSGTIAGSTLKDEGCDDDTCSASSESLDVAVWPPAER